MSQTYAADRVVDGFDIARGAMGGSAKCMSADTVYKLYASRHADLIAVVAVMPNSMALRQLGSWRAKIIRLMEHWRYFAHRNLAANTKYEQIEIGRYIDRFLCALTVSREILLLYSKRAPTQPVA